MSARPPLAAKPRPLEIAILGNDALVAALPARPVQLAHAILACGFDHVVPVSWGEELVAEHVLQAVAGRPRGPVIFCACPEVRERLLASGPEMAPRLLSTVSPAIAAARYLRALHANRRVRITFLGGCAALGDPAIDVRVLPDELLHRLAARGIAPLRQPAVFDSVIPPDRRRYFSRAGGIPSPDLLARHAPQWRLVEIDEEEFSTSLADTLLAGGDVLIDVTPRLGCSSCGVFGASRRGVSADAALGATLEPPRSPSPVLDHGIAVAVESTARRPDLESRRAERVHLPSGSPLADRAPAPHETPVRSIELARRRAELRHIAITPSGVAIIGGGSARRASTTPTSGAESPRRRIATTRPTVEGAPDARSSIAALDQHVSPHVTSERSVATPVVIDVSLPLPAAVLGAGPGDEPSSWPPTGTDTPASTHKRRRTPVHETFQLARLFARGAGTAATGGTPSRNRAVRRQAAVIERRHTPHGGTGVVRVPRHHTTTPDEPAPIAAGATPEPAREPEVNLESSCADRVGVERQHRRPPPAARVARTRAPRQEPSTLPGRFARLLPYIATAVVVVAAAIAIAMILQGGPLAR